MTNKFNKTDQEWRQELTEEQFYITRQKGTERPFTGKYYNFKGKGSFQCVCCGETLFNSETKYNSGSGWPSFYAPIDDEKIKTEKDISHGMIRTEAMCRNCDAHLGHLFDDGPQPTGLRYCVNSVSLKFVPSEERS
jgi:peptide-methionine (R)-S-oxide reductase